MARREHGFTVIELLVAMVLLVILLEAAYLLLGSSIRHSGEVQERTNLQIEARAALDGVVRDLRQAYTGDETAPALESIGSSQIQFLSPDRAEPFHLRRITYRMTGADLERAVDVSTNTDGPPWTFPGLGAWASQLGSIVDPSVFTYQDANGAPTTDPVAVRTVGISLVVATLTSPGRQLTYRTAVNLRTPQ